MRASGESGLPVSVITVAPACLAYSSTARLSMLLPDSEGMTTMECAPRCAEPVWTICAAQSVNAPNRDRACSSDAAGYMRIPAPPEPRKKTLRAPAARRAATASDSPSARPTAPDWMRRKRASSKLSISKSVPQASRRRIEAIAKCAVVADGLSRQGSSRLQRVHRDLVAQQAAQHAPDQGVACAEAVGQRGGLRRESDVDAVDHQSRAAGTFRYEHRGRAAGRRLVGEGDRCLRRQVTPGKACTPDVADQLVHVAPWPAAEVERHLRRCCDIGKLCLEAGIVAGVKGVEAGDVGKVVG